MTDCIPEGNETEVYRIADYVRQSYVVAVMLGPLGGGKVPEGELIGEYESDLLRVLGRRVWTFPVSGFICAITLLTQLRSYCSLQAIISPST